MSLVCPICYEEYSSIRPARILRKCGHDLCDVCIREAVRSRTPKSNNTPLLRCPSCRTPMMSAEVASDHMRILTTGSSIVNSRTADHADLSDLLMEELFPKSIALTHIHSRIDLASHQRQEMTVRDCETDVLMVELCQRIPSGRVQSEESPPEAKSPRIRPEADPDKSDGSGELEMKLEKVMFQMAKNIRSSWSAAEMGGFPRSYTEGLEDVSLWVFILWLIQASGAVYKYICFAPNRYWRKCRPEEKIQVLALAQGIPLFVAACYYCASVSR